MSGLSRGRTSVNRKPARAAACQTSASCAMPATGTAQAKAKPKSQPKVLAALMADIKITFRRTGAAAAAAKRPVAFSTPDKSAASEINRM